MSELISLPALSRAGRRMGIRVGLATLALGLTGAFNATVSLAADEKAAASAILAAAAGGSLSDIETTVAMTAKDAAATFGSAGKAAKEFRSAGRR